MAARTLSTLFCTDTIQLNLETQCPFYILNLARIKLSAILRSFCRSPFRPKKRFKSRRTCLSKRWRLGTAQADWATLSNLAEVVAEIRGAERGRRRCGRCAAFKTFTITVIHDGSNFAHALAESVVGLDWAPGEIFADGVVLEGGGTELSEILTIWTSGKAGAQER